MALAALDLRATDGDPMLRWHTRRRGVCSVGRRGVRGVCSAGRRRVWACRIGWRCRVGRLGWQRKSGWRCRIGSECRSGWQRDSGLQRRIGCQCRIGRLGGGDCTGWTGPQTAGLRVTEQRRADAGQVEARTSTSLVSRRIVYENRMQKNIEARGTCRRCGSWWEWSERRDPRDSRGG